MGAQAIISHHGSQHHEMRDSAGRAEGGVPAADVRSAGRRQHEGRHLNAGQLDRGDQHGSADSVPGAERPAIGSSVRRPLTRLTTDQCHLIAQSAGVLPRVPECGGEERVRQRACSEPAWEFCRRRPPSPPPPPPPAVAYSGVAYDGYLTGCQVSLSHRSQRSPLKLPRCFGSGTAPPRCCRGPLLCPLSLGAAARMDCDHVRLSWQPNRTGFHRADGARQWHWRLALQVQAITQVYPLMVGAESNVTAGSWAIAVPQQPRLFSIDIPDKGMHVFNASVQVMQPRRTQIGPVAAC